MVQVSHQVLGSMSLAQVSHLGMENINLVQVTHLVLGRIGLIQDSHLVLGSKGMDMVSHLHMGLAKVSLLDMEDMGHLAQGRKSMDMRKFTMESQAPKVRENREHPKDSLGIAVDSLSLDKNSPQIQGLQEDQDRHLFTPSPVRVRNTQKFLGDTQNLLRVMVDISKKNRGQQVMEDREVLKDNLGTAVDSLSLGMSSHHIVALREDPEGHQFTLNPVKVKNIL